MPYLSASVPKVRSGAVPFRAWLCLRLLSSSASSACLFPPRLVVVGLSPPFRTGGSTQGRSFHAMATALLPSVLTSHFTRSTTRRLPALDPHIHLATLLAACLARRFQKREPRKLATRYPTSLVPRRGYRDTQGGGGAAKVVAFVLSLSLPLAGAPGPGDRACARPPAVKCQRVRPVDLHLQLRPPTTAAGVGVSSGVVRRKPPTGGLALLDLEWLVRPRTNL